MIAGLRRFVEELRRAGIRVSPAEWIDALRAAQRIGIEERESFRQLLSATLVKRAGQRRIFDETFERFFAGPRRGRSPRPDGHGSVSPATGAPPPGGRAPIAPAAATPRRPPDAGPREAASPKTVRTADRLRDRLEGLRAGREPRHRRLRHVVVSPRRAAGPEQPSDPRRLQLAGRMSTAEERRLAREVRRIVEEIRLRSARRFRRSSRGGADLRRIFRESQRSGGVPFRLPRRRRKRSRVRVVLLLDISWSTARAAGLFLALAGEFLDFGRQTRVLVFVDRVREVTGELGPGRDGDYRLRLPETIPGLDRNAPSDYGRMWHQLLGSSLRPRGRGTALVVLGDGRANRFDPLSWAFAEIADSCGAVLWLVPEPRQRWGTGDSALADYLPHVDTVVEAGDLDGLARGVRELLHRL